MKTLLLALAMTACAHHVGDPCKVGDAFCADSHSALTCGAGGLVAMPCPGPKGCLVDEKQAVMCDQSEGAKAGEKCFPEYSGTGQCGMDNRGYLFCADGQWKEVTCPKDGHCAKSSAGIACQFVEVK